MLIHEPLSLFFLVVFEFLKHIWKLKDNKENYKISWSIIFSASADNNISKRCNLCLTEKLHIIKADKACNLNRRNELISKCRHENKYFLMNIDLHYNRFKLFKLSKVYSSLMILFPLSHHLAKVGKRGCAARQSDQKLEIRETYSGSFKTDKASKLQDHEKELQEHEPT